MGDHASVWYRRAAACVMVGAALAVAATFRDFGITWDEHLQQVYGELLLAYYASGFADDRAFSFVNLYLYGGLFDLLAAVAQSILPFDVYDVRHLVGGLFGVFGLWGLWTLTNDLGGARAALIAVTFAATCPLLTGHAFTNPKDAPLAALTVWACVFICRTWREAPRVTPLTIFGLGVSLGAAMGQRIIAGHLVVWAVLVAAIWPWLDRSAAPRAIAAVRAGCLAAPLAIVVMALAWPWSVQSPMNVIRALTEFSDFPFDVPVLWSGVVLSSQSVPATYIPRLLSAQLAEVVLVGLVFAAAVAARTMRRPVPIDGRTFGLLFVLLAVAGPLAIAAVTRPTLYNGLRHFLFVVPLLMVLAALGVDRALQIAATRGRSAVAGVVALLVLGTAGSLAEMVRLHPYQYLAFNRLTGGVAGAKGQFELNYWGASLTELARRVRDDPSLAGRSGIKTFVCGRQESTAHVLGDRFVIVNDLATADVYLGLDELVCTTRHQPIGATIAEVRRDGVLLGSAVRLMPSE
jgi:hypothetical protein